MPTGATNIGTNLADDHPISLVYTVGNADLKAKTAALTGWLGATTIQDLLRYASEVIECSSCHDVHNNIKGLFLRQDNSGSQLCLGCHDK